MTKHEIEPRPAVKRWLGSLQTERSDETISAYWYRLKLFVEWCEEKSQIETISDLDGWLLDDYEAHRADIANSTNTLNNEFTTLKNFVEYCERIEVVDEGLAEKIEIPSVPKEEQSSNIKLADDDARFLLAKYRDDPNLRASRQHAVLEILWHTGARLSGINALDLDDFEETPDGDQHFLVFRNRPESETRLKKGIEGERPVLISDDVAYILEEYIENFRHDATDEYGREPLITSNQGRPAKNSIRMWTYFATLPCHWGSCPHGVEEIQDCEYRDHQQHGGCPSSRSPHQIRTGAITWMRDSGMSEETVAERCNASIETIREHYDKQDPIEEMLRRRADETRDLDISQDDTSQEDDNND